LDVVVLFEAIYYLPSAERFVRECRRVLRPGGKILIATANKDLYDFNPSPHSVRYYGVTELRDVVSQHGFEAEFFGDAPITAMPLRQKLLRPLKRTAVALGALPKTMEGKKALRRLVFGRLIRMPLELKPGLMAVPRLNPLPPDAPDRNHKIIFCAATLPGLSPDSRCIPEST
jgi:SAM-dependent methyltransferase